MLSPPELLAHFQQMAHALLTADQNMVNYDAHTSQPPNNALEQHTTNFRRNPPVYIGVGGTERAEPTNNMQKLTR